MQDDFACVRLFESRDDAQNGCLAAAGSSEQHEGFAFSYVEADIFEHGRFLETLADPLDARGDPGPLRAVWRPRDVEFATVGRQFHLSNHTS